MAFQLPNFSNPPQAVITDETDPPRAEIITYQQAVTTWCTNVLAQLTILNPAHGFNTGVPAQPAAAADTGARIARLAALRLHVQTLFPIYAAAYSNLANALVFGQPPPLPANPARGPKTKLPDEFLGKSAATARHFIAQCNNYAVLNPFPDPQHQIRWALQLLSGDASKWRDEQFALCDRVPPPAHVLDWGDFQRVFEARWTDPHEAEKAMDKMMKGTITQRTSVKIYNDLFNETLALSGMADNNVMVVRAYTTGLKPVIRAAAIAPLMNNQAITFPERQALMARIDDELMQTQFEPRSTPTPRRTPHFVFNVQDPIPRSASTPVQPGVHTSATPTPSSRGTTPIKVEVARQFTRLTPEERETLKRTGGCFRCRQQGHMAHQCPRNSQIAAATLEDSGPAPAPANTPPDVSTTTGENQDF